MDSFFWFFVRVLLDFYFSFFCFCYHPNQKKNGNHETIVPFFSPDDKTFCVFFCFLFCALLFFVWNDLSWWSYFFKRHQSTTVFYRVTTEMRPWLFWHAPLRLFYFIFFWGRMFSIVPLNLSLNRQLHKDIGLEYQSFKEKEVLGLAVPTWRSDFARKEIRSIPKVFLFVFFLKPSWNIDPYRSLSHYSNKSKNRRIETKRTFYGRHEIYSIFMDASFYQPTIHCRFINATRGHFDHFFFAYRENVRQDPFHFYGDTWWPASVDLILCLGQNGIFSFKLSYSFKSILTKVASTFFFPSKSDHKGQQKSLNNSNETQSNRKFGLIIHHPNNRTLLKRKKKID